MVSSHRNGSRSYLFFYCKYILPRILQRVTANADCDCLYRKETGSGAPTSPAWFALASSALGRSAVEGKDGYMILTLPSARPSSSEPQEPAASGTTGETSESTSKSTNHRGFVCWEYIGASILT